MSTVATRRGLRALTEADEPVALAEVVLASFLRIVTNASIFDPPTPMETASAFCQHLVFVSDAYLAALAIEHACELVTTDGDFARFKGLRWRHPLSA